VTITRLRVRVSGVVQGVGYRPFVYALAREFELSGYVTNDAAGVLIEVQGDDGALAGFTDSLRSVAPLLAVVEGVGVTEVDVVPGTDFEIRESRLTFGTTSIPPDTAICVDCAGELRDPSDRRFGYPFIACTNCGPRYTIVTGLPYNREATTMVDFPMCAECQAEYEDPESRRFHAQPTACRDCGPALTLKRASVSSQGSAAVDGLVLALQQGEIVAVKGVGGYHLACDAHNAAAVDRLRSRKGRGDKPFAVMVRDLAVAHQIVDIGDRAEAVLQGRAAPIVIATALDSDLLHNVAPGNVTIGVLLPYAPLHLLLFDAGAPSVLVMTSGNLTDEPICVEPGEAEQRLAHIADAFAHHDRRIYVPCDDSVVQFVGDDVQPVRRSRGYAPLPIRLPIDSAPIVAVGGELKTTAGVASGNSAWLSQHIGDTENFATLAVLARTVSTLTTLLGIEPEAVVSDAHPGYLSRRWAGEEAARRGVPHLVVQHHHAHLASLLAEHNWSAGEPVLGVAFDGTGYGTDGAIWGGEFLLGEYSQVSRVASLLPIQLPGGDAATKRPARVALAHLRAAGLPWSDDLPNVAACDESERRIIGRMLETGSGCTPTTSIGRFFDGVAATLGVRFDAEYEGQAAIELEALASAVSDVDVTDAACWSPDVQEGPDRLLLDPRPTMLAAVAAVRAGDPIDRAALAFHLGLASAVAEIAVRVRETSGVRTVGLTGGVFANRILTLACVARLHAAGFHVLTHRVVPPNDGGLALGQLAVAAAHGARYA
jgi:hydrogenase maturation protein HypF